MSCVYRPQIIFQDFNVLVSVYSTIHSCNSSHTMPDYATPNHYTDLSLGWGTHAVRNFGLIFAAPNKNPLVCTQNNSTFIRKDYFVPLTIYIPPNFTRAPVKFLRLVRTSLNKHRSSLASRLRGRPLRVFPLLKSYNHI